MTYILTDISTFFSLDILHFVPICAFVTNKMFVRFYAIIFCAFECQKTCAFRFRNTSPAPSKSIKKLKWTFQCNATCHACASVVIVVNIALDLDSLEVFASVKTRTA